LEAILVADVNLCSPVRMNAKPCPEKRDGVKDTEEGGDFPIPSHRQYERHNNIG
jgi:hypothetical protein